MPMKLKLYHEGIGHRFDQHYHEFKNRPDCIVTAKGFSGITRIMATREGPGLGGALW